MTSRCRQKKTRAKHGHYDTQRGLLAERLERWTCDSKGRGFDSRPFRFHVTTLGKLFTHTFASVTKQCNLVPVKER